jgi:hypothetical protein
VENSISDGESNLICLALVLSINNKLPNLTHRPLKHEVRDEELSTHRSLERNVTVRLWWRTVRIISWEMRVKRKWRFQVHPIPENVTHLIFRLSIFFHFGDYGISQLSTSCVVLLFHSVRGEDDQGEVKWFSQKINQTTWKFCLWRTK